MNEKPHLDLPFSANPATENSPAEVREPPNDGKSAFSVKPRISIP